MSILLTTLMPPLAREMGDVDTTNLYYNSDQLFSSLNDAVDEYNAEAITQQFSKSGTGDAETISPTPDDVQKRLLILYGALILTRGDIAKAARNAIIHSNPAGRTDLSKMVQSFELQAARLEDKIEKLRLQGQQAAVEGEAGSDSWGVELRGRPTSEPEAVGILDITTTET